MDWKIKYGLVGIVLGVVIIFLSLDAIYFLKEPIIVNSENVKNLKAGDHVKLDVSISMGAAISETTTETKNGKTVSSKESSRYYLMPYLDEYGYISYMITAKVRSDDFSLLEKAYDVFANWWDNPTTELPSEKIITLEGIVKNMKDEEKKYVQTYLDIEPKVMEPIYIGINDSTQVKLTALLGIAFIVISGVLLFFGIRKAVQNKKAMEEARRNNAGYYSAPQDATFNNGTVDFNNGPVNFNNGPVEFNNNPTDAASGNYNEVAPTPVETMNFNEVSTTEAPQLENTDNGSDTNNSGNNSF